MGKALQKGAKMEKGIKKTKQVKFLAQYHSLYNQMRSGETTVVDPQSVIDIVWKKYRRGATQDAQEFLTYLFGQVESGAEKLDSLDNGRKSPKHVKTLKKNLTGVSLSTLTCHKCNNSRSTPEEFQYLKLACVDLNIKAHS